jgi:hypothetical protein
MYTTTTLFQATGLRVRPSRYRWRRNPRFFPLTLLRAAFMSVTGIAWAIPAGV